MNDLENPPPPICWMSSYPCAQSAESVRGIGSRYAPTTFGYLVLAMAVLWRTLFFGQLSWIVVEVWEKIES
jgi:hypothetical protein